MNTKFEKIRDWIYNNNGKLLNTATGAGITLRIYDVKNKTIIVQTWDKADEGFMCYITAQEKNDINAEIKALDNYINNRR